MEEKSQIPLLSKVIFSQLFLAFGIFIGLILLNFINDNLGVIGIDSDDRLRFVQIKDYLHGQSWFDTDQYRMGLTAAGTDMHWSRIPDIPIICLTHILSLFMGQDKALIWAISLWPPMSGALLFLCLMKGADYISYEGNRKYLYIFTVLLSVFFILGNYRFQSGSIDHHNVQFIFITLAMVLALDARLRFWRYFISGMAVATSVAIGPEVYLFAAVICGFVALNWLISGQSVSAAAQGFGAGLGFMTLGVFVLTVPSFNYALIYCDALSLITVTAACIGGFGLAIVARLNSYYNAEDSIFRRMIGLFLLAIIVLGVLSFQAPQCLSNPLKSLPADVTELWLNNISEAVPAYKLTDKWQMIIPFILGPLIICAYVFIQAYYKAFEKHKNLKQLWNHNALIVLLFLVASILTIYQIRFAPFAYMIAILPLSRWVSQTYEKGIATQGPNINYILCLALSMQIIWALPGSVFVKDSDNAEAASNLSSSIGDEVCVSDEILEALNSVPNGFIVTSTNFAGPLLMHTHHRVMSGNYHRNWRGISAEINISILPPAEARELLIKHKVDYLYYCKNDDTLAYKSYSENGLKAELLKGNIPNFLTPVPNMDFENGRAVLYKVNRAP